MINGIYLERSSTIAKFNFTGIKVSVISGQCLEGFWVFPFTQPFLINSYDHGDTVRITATFLSSAPGWYND